MPLKFASWEWASFELTFEYCVFKIFGPELHKYVQKKLIPRITVESMTTFIACVNFDAINPTRALQKLFTVNTRNNMMHSMLDSAGTRLLNVEKLIEYSSSISMFMSSVLIQTFDALFGVGTSKKNENLGEKTGFGLKSIIIGQSHVMSASPETISIIAQLQKSIHAMHAPHGVVVHTSCGSKNKLPRMQ